MWYYRVNKEHYNGRNTLVEGELLTRREIDKFFPEIKIEHYVKRGILTPTFLSTKNIFHSFGCRFEIKKEH